MITLEMVMIETMSNILVPPYFIISSSAYRKSSRLIGFVVENLGSVSFDILLTLLWSSENLQVCGEFMSLR